MPTYTFRHKTTEEQKTVILSFAEREKFLEDNTDWEQVVSSPKIVSGVKTALRMTDDGWKDRLKQIDKAAGRRSKVRV